MNYETARLAIFATGTIPDGYNGKLASVGFALLEGKIVTVADCGCFGAGLPDVVDEQEARWILEKHPSARHIKLR